MNARARARVCPSLIYTYTSWKLLDYDRARARLAMAKEERPRASVVVTAYLPYNAVAASPSGGGKERAAEREG
jgi:hypothetical protein